LAKTETSGKFEVGEAGVDVTLTLNHGTAKASAWTNIVEIT